VPEVFPMIPASSKALWFFWALFLTRQDRVVYVPTREGYAVMMSVEDPDAFVRALSGARPL
jgi:hypothetical protein